MIRESEEDHVSSTDAKLTTSIGEPVSTLREFSLIADGERGADRPVG